jgi:alpha-methylacyl-CoA racemase
MADKGPLAGVRVVELAGIGPAPFAAMMLAEMGAEVVRVDRPSGTGGVFAGEPRQDLLNRGKKSVLLDLKQSDGVQAFLDLAGAADILIEGFRPGVAERLGVGPEQCHERNPALVYGRMTGWGQEGPLSATAGHDVTYIAVTGALHACGQADGPPQIPANLVGDFGGGSLYLVSGVLAALHEARARGRGRVVDAAIVDGAAHLLTGVHTMLAAGQWEDRRGVNLFDGGAPFYSVYATSDGKYMAVGALEPKFYAELLARLGLDEDPGQQHDRARWPLLRERIGARFAERTQEEWSEVFAASDACAAPVMSMAEAAAHPHISARGSIVVHDGYVQAGPAPRFSGPAGQPGPAKWESAPAMPETPPRPGQQTREVLAEWGVGSVDTLIADGIAQQS